MSNMWLPAMGHCREVYNCFCSEMAAVFVSGNSFLAMRLFALWKEVEMVYQKDTDRYYKHANICHYSAFTFACRVNSLLKGHSRVSCQISLVLHINLEGRKEMFLFNDALNTFYFTVIWRQTYG